MHIRELFGLLQSYFLFVVAIYNAWIFAKHGANPPYFSFDCIELLQYYYEYKPQKLL